MRRKSPLLLFITCALLSLSGCTTSSGGWGMPSEHSISDNTESSNSTAMSAPPALQTQSPALRLAVLVPLSGPSAPLGDGLLNAAQLALVDLKATRVELVPIDTGTSPAQAASAVQEAQKEQVSAIIGPVFADTTKSVAAALSGSSLPAVSFSTDSSAAGSSVFVMGILPELQAAQIVDFAASRGVRNYAILAGNDEYGRLVSAAFTQRARLRGLTVTQVIRLPQNPAELEKTVVDFATGPRPVDAVFLPLAPSAARVVSDLLAKSGMTPDKVRRLGTGLWEDTDLAKAPSLQGAWFAAPDPASRARFENKYAQAYGVTPPRIASLGYDATALMIAASRSGLSEGHVARASLLNPNGFLGTDGIFRFRSNGTVDRALAVLELSNGRLNIIAPASRSFLKPDG